MMKTKTTAFDHAANIDWTNKEENVKTADGYCKERENIQAMDSDCNNLTILTKNKESRLGFSR